MADFACLFIEPQLPADGGSIQFIPLADPIDYPAVIMPLTESGDISPPGLSVTPVVPGPLLKDSEVLVDMVDISSVLSLAVVTARWLDVTECVWDGQEFTEDYDDASTRVVHSPQHWTFHIKRNLGWPAPLPPEETLSIRAKVADSRGNVA